MHRRPLLDMLAAYAELHPEELRCIDRVRELVAQHRDCFERTCLPGHVTGSIWIVSPERDRFLLTHHRKLGRWLQLGGHADGDPDVMAVALREAREESGLRQFSFAGLPHASRGLPLVPVDVDVHTIPARGDEPAHEHHDIRFLLIAAPGQSIEKSDESLDLCWFPLEALETTSGEESLLRLGRKAHALLRHPDLRQIET